MNPTRPPSGTWQRFTAQSRVFHLDPVPKFGAEVGGMDGGEDSARGAASGDCCQSDTERSEYIGTRTSGFDAEEDDDGVEIRLPPGTLRRPGSLREVQGLCGIVLADSSTPAGPEAVIPLLIHLVPQADQNEEEGESVLEKDVQSESQWSQGRVNTIYWLKAEEDDSGTASNTNDVQIRSRSGLLSVTKVPRSQWHDASAHSSGEVRISYLVNLQGFEAKRNSRLHQLLTTCIPSDFYEVRYKAPSMTEDVITVADVGTETHPSRIFAVCGQDGEMRTNERLLALPLSDYAGYSELYAVGPAEIFADFEGVRGRCGVTEPPSTADTADLPDRIKPAFDASTSSSDETASSGTSVSQVSDMGRAPSSETA